MEKRCGQTGLREKSHHRIEGSTHGYSPKPRPILHGPRAPSQVESGPSDEWSHAFAVDSKGLSLSRGLNRGSEPTPLTSVSTDASGLEEYVMDEPKTGIVPRVIVHDDRSLNLTLAARPKHALH